MSSLINSALTNLSGLTGISDLKKAFDSFYLAYHYFDNLFEPCNMLTAENTTTYCYRHIETGQEFKFADYVYYPITHYSEVIPHQLEGLSHTSIGLAKLTFTAAILYGATYIPSLARKTFNQS